MDMKSFKLWQLPGFILCLLLGLVFFSSCDKDDDETGGGGVIGYWLPLTDLRDMAREAVEEDNADEDGFTGGAVSYRFLNANTVESFTTNCYIGHKSGAFHTETISGKTVSFVAENVRLMAIRCISRMVPSVR